MAKLENQDYEKLIIYIEKIMLYMKDDKYFDIQSMRTMLLKLRMRLHIKPSEVKRIEDMYESIQKYYNKL